MHVSLHKISALPFKEQCSLIWCMKGTDFIESSLYLMSKFPGMDTKQIQIRFLNETSDIFYLKRLLEHNVDYLEITLHLLQTQSANVVYVLEAAKKKNPALAKEVIDVIVNNIELSKYRHLMFDTLLAVVVIGYDYRKVVKLLFNTYKEPASQSLVQRFKGEIGSKELNDYIIEQLMIEDILS